MSGLETPFHSQKVQMTPPCCEIQLAYKLIEVTKRMEEYNAGAKSASDVAVANSSRVQPEEVLTRSRTCV